MKRLQSNNYTIHSSVIAHSTRFRDVADQMLTYWRRQVLRLLVELEQQRVERTHAEGRTGRQLARVEDACRDARHQSETARLKLLASEAALTVERGRCEVGVSVLNFSIIEMGLLLDVVLYF